MKETGIEFRSHKLSSVNTSSWRRPLKTSICRLRPFGGKYTIPALRPLRSSSWNIASHQPASLCVSNLAQQWPAGGIGYSTTTNMLKNYASVVHSQFLPNVLQPEMQLARAKLKGLSRASHRRSRNDVSARCCQSRYLRRPIQILRAPGSV